MATHGELKDWGRRFIRDVLNNHDLAQIDRYISPDIHLHDTIADLPNGLEGLKAQFTELWAAFPDIHAHVDLEIAEDPILVIKVTQKGTNTGKFRGLEPSGNSFAYQEVHIVKVIDDKAVEYWGVVNSAHLLQQIGAVPEALPRPAHRDLETV